MCLCFLAVPLFFFFINFILLKLDQTCFNIDLLGEAFFLGATYASVTWLVLFLAMTWNLNVCATMQSDADWPIKETIF